MDSTVDPPPDDRSSADAPPDRVERAQRCVPADAQEIFDLLADPRRHHEIDGSGSVRNVVAAPDRLDLGARFTMKMRLGVPYRITSEVVEFDEPHLIAWRHVGHHVWRYRLEPADGGTIVTEEFDWRSSRSPAALRAMRAPQRNAEAIEATLDNLVERFS